MPRVVAKCTTEWQARRVADQYRVPRRQLPLTERMGEDEQMVVVRKSPTWWLVELYDKWEWVQSEQDVSFP